MMRGGGGRERGRRRPSEQSRGGKDGVEQNQKNGGGSFATRDTETRRRLRMVAEELHKRIQQVILMEIAVDRDTPIPSNYRRAVDGYFHELANDAQTMMQGTDSSGRKEAL